MQDLYVLKNHRLTNKIPIVAMVGIYRSASKYVQTSKSLLLEVRPQFRRPKSPSVVPLYPTLLPPYSQDLWVPATAFRSLRSSRSACGSRVETGDSIGKTVIVQNKMRIPQLETLD